jgi:hypothetical protein
VVVVVVVVVAIVILTSCRQRGSSGRRSVINLNGGLSNSPIKSKPQPKSQSQLKPQEILPEFEPANQSHFQPQSESPQQTQQNTPQSRPESPSNRLKPKPKQSKPQCQSEQQSEYKLDRPKSGRNTRSPNILSPRSLRKPHMLGSPKSQHKFKYQGPRSPPQQFDVPQFQSQFQTPPQVQFAPPKFLTAYSPEIGRSNSTEMA